MMKFEELPCCAEIEHQDHVLKLAATLVGYAKKSREHGILFLKNFLDDEICEEIPFLRLMLSYLTRGMMDACVLERLGKNYIASSDLSKEEKLKYILITESVLDIMEGINEELLAEILGSYLGMNMRKEYILALNKNDITSGIELC